MADFQLKHFYIRAIGDDAMEEQLNRFLRGHQVLAIREEFLPNGADGSWCISVKNAAKDSTDEKSGGRVPVGGADTLTERSRPSGCSSAHRRPS